MLTYKKEDVKLFLDTAINQRLYFYSDLACHADATHGELLAQRWANFNFANQTILVNKARGKSGEEVYEEDMAKIEKEMRVIEVTLDTVQALNAHRKRQQ